MATGLSIEDVNRVVKSLDTNMFEVADRVNQLDKNVMGDIAHLSSYIDKLGTAVAELKASISVPPPVVHVQKLSRFEIALAIGVGVYVGIKVNESFKPKKEQ